MNTYKYAPSALLILLALAGCAPETQDSAADAAGIKANSLAWFESYNAGDADGVAALYAENGVVMAPGVGKVSGRAAIRDFIAADIASNKAAGSSFRADPVTDGGAAGDTAWISGTWSVLDGSDATVATGKYATIYERNNGEWEIVRDIWNLDAPAATQYDAELAALDVLIDVYNTQDYDKLDAVALPNYTRRAPDQNADSLDELKAFIAQIHAAYPDFRITTDAAAAGPDGAFLKWTVNATNTGEGAQPPTGNAINMTGISHYRFVDGKMATETVTFDSAQLLAQLQGTAMPHAAQ